MTTYKCCCCKKTCPGSVRAYVDEGSEEAIRVALEIWTATISRHTIYLSPADAEALGEELKRLAKEVS